MSEPLRIAIVGGGVSGLVTARILAARHRVVVYEAASYLGGHTCTIPVPMGNTTHPVDVGFMVFNAQTYPLFCRLLDLLQVSRRVSNMSFSVRCDLTGMEFQGSNLNGLFANRWNALRPRFYQMLYDIVRFNRMVPQQVGEMESMRPPSAESLHDFLHRHRLSNAFRNWYLLPMAAAIWSAPQAQVLNMPAQFLLRFFQNHGLAQLKNRPVWFTIPQGAQSYVERLLDGGRFEYHINCPVDRIARHGSGVTVVAGGTDHHYDKVVMACHGDQSLRLLQDPDSLERHCLNAFHYQDNRVVLHTDREQMPRAKRAWASWNYRIDPSVQPMPTVTYWLNQLQGHETLRPLFVTLNPVNPIPVAEIVREMSFRHPIFNLQTWESQQLLAQLQGRRNTYYCGAYWGNGFHEDGVRSAVQVAESLGLDWEQCIVASTPVTSGIDDRNR